MLGPDGLRRRHPTLPRVDCRYWITAWDADTRLEHALLGATLWALLGRTELDTDLPLGYSEQAPPPTIDLVTRPSDSRPPGLTSQLKPGLDLVVTTTVETPGTGDGPATRPIAENADRPDSEAFHLGERPWPDRDGW